MLADKLFTESHVEFKYLNAVYDPVNVHLNIRIRGDLVWWRPQNVLLFPPYQVWPVQVINQT